MSQTIRIEKGNVTRGQAYLPFRNRMRQKYLPRILVPIR